MRTFMKISAIAFCFLLAFSVSLTFAGDSKLDPKCPCYNSVKAMEDAYNTNPAVKELMDLAFKNMKQLPPEYPDGNPWIGKGINDLTAFFQDWCTFLPTAQGSGDTGLKYIEDFVWFYYQNPFGVKFVQTSPGKELLAEFVKERGAFMDSKESTKTVAKWLSDYRIEKEDYNIPDPKAADGGFKSFNEFFSRTLKPGVRPQTMPDRDYIIAAPTDCIMNSIPQKITYETTKIPTKGRQALTINKMLDGSKYAKNFVGGTALSCVLMPNTYHHFHSAVSGNVVESKVVKDAMFGYDNFPVWAPPTGNVGYYGTDFSQFENFQRGYYIVDTGEYGHVAMIAVGLNTISSVIQVPPYKDVTKPVAIKRGDELGYFLYGGSLFIMIFEPGRYGSDAIQVRLGNQIGTFDTKKDQPEK